jgi:tetratricopeptide (TPR) repeat protein
VNVGQPRVAALALAAALAAPWPAAGSLEGVEREAAALEARLAEVEAASRRPDESGLARARRKFVDGETQYLLGDWDHAAVMLYDAVEQREFRETADYPQALAYLGDALRMQGSCGAALAQYGAVLALGQTPTRAAALAGTLECRVALRRLDGVDALLDEVRRAFPGGPPPEVAYLAAKAAYFRTDVPAAERTARAFEAFAAVGPPLHLAATYFQGVLRLEAGDLAEAAERFDRCSELQAKEPRQVEVREQCLLALARVLGEQEFWEESEERYRAIPLESPRFNEATYELAWNQVRAKEYARALRTADMIVDLAPESQLAPEATILTGHLALQLGRFAEASESFSRVINAYAPVRDEIDAILTLHEDPIRYFNELIVRQGKAFDLASVLPALAVKWATSQKDVGGAMELVAAMEAGRANLEAAEAVAGRIQALLERKGGLDAAPALRASWLAAEALQNGAARLRGEVADAASAAALRATPPERRSVLEEVRRDRLEQQRRLEGLPRTPEEVSARQARQRKALDAAERAAFQAGWRVKGSAAAVAATETWLEQHREEITGDEEARSDVFEELRRHRAILAGYEGELRQVVRDVDAARDAVSSVAAVEDEARLRRDYLAAVERERAVAVEARRAMPPLDLAELDRGSDLAERLGRAEQRAVQLEARLAGEAAVRARALRAGLDDERDALAGHRASLDEVRRDSRDVVGQIAFRSFSAVRSQFYRLVLKADVGIVDVAWSRKRVRLDRIQELSRQKAAEVEALDRDAGLVLKEAE